MSGKRIPFYGQQTRSDHPILGRYTRGKSSITECSAVTTAEPTEERKSTTLSGRYDFRRQVWYFVLHSKSVWRQVEPTQITQTTFKRTPTLNTGTCMCKYITFIQEKTSPPATKME
jgi:hypothetical protein